MLIINTDTMEQWNTPKKQEIDYIINHLKTYYTKVLIEEDKILVSGEILTFSNFNL